MSQFINFTQKIMLSDEEVEQVFNHRMDEIIDGWYIAESEMLRTRGQTVLCKDIQHPHNGDFIRDDEKPIDDPDLRHVAFALMLRGELEKRKEK